MVGIREEPLMKAEQLRLGGGVGSDHLGNTVLSGHQTTLDSSCPETTL